MQLGAHVLSGQLPEDKVAAVQFARCEGKLVGMVGDGINDAPALAAAEVGVAMGCGADLSRDSAAVCLLSNDLARLPWTIALARRTVQIIRQNLFWAFAYNVIGIGLAVTGRLNPVWAGAAMAASSVLVVTNSLRLNRFPEPFVATDVPSNSKRASETVHPQRPGHFDNRLPQIVAPINDLQPMP
jgi:cation transport ATPase